MTSHREYKYEPVDFASLSPAEVDALIQRAHTLRAQQAGILFQALRQRLGKLLRGRPASNDQPFGATPSRSLP